MLAWFLAVPATGFLLISSIHVELALTPESLYAALTAAGAAGGGCLLRRIHRP
ncbi:MULTISPECIES: hypothetical protein [Streptomyces]|uniref:Uncharacterized protein n=2 Tax=Streptomyces TaxID=1883 RepID=A0ABW7T147_9ACTN|nr:hypothetical protein [Streptomyces luteoverticillatus]